VPPGASSGGGGASPASPVAAPLRRVLLSPDLVPPAVAAASAPPSPALAAFLADAASGASLVAHSLTLPYASLSAAAALRALLPPGVAPPAAFEEVGHIVHLNLRAPQLPWARLIGAVLLDKCSRARTVVNKASELAGPHRTFALQLCAGEARYTARVAEHGASYDVDVSRVYWNSRLGSERARLVALFAPGQTVLDLCAGAGPIAVAAARAGATVLANDINPDAAAALTANAALNGVSARVRVFNDDGVALARRLLRGADGSPPPAVAHVVANLPGGAPELVGAALARAFCRDTWPPGAPLPLCHVYAFSKAADPEADILARIAAALRVPPAALRAGAPGGDAPGTGEGGAVRFTRVRDVAPGKPMLRATFRLPPQAAYDDAD
jgi:tRNA (guanine37-N1)-methyltransferase